MRVLALCAAALVPALAHALVIRPAQLDFGTVETGDSSLATVWLVNNQEEPLQPGLLGDSGQTLALELPGTPLAPGDSLAVDLYFRPVQNLDYTEALVLGGPEGAALLSYTGSGDFPGTTWDDTANLWGSELWEVLAGRVRQHAVLSYSGARNHMFSTIDNENGFVECVYTGTQVQTSGIPPSNTMNTEHTWPQSMFENPDTATSDLHHLYPTMSTVNSSRGNLPFGEVVDPDDGWPQGGSWRGQDAQGITVFEPRDEHKGDAARSLFYFALHYGNDFNFLTYQEPTLRQWALQDPVSPKERDRNDGIQAVQGNRNPLVDQPALIERIHSFSGSADFPNASALVQWPGSLDLGVETGIAGTAAGIVLHNGGRSTVSLWNLAASPALLEFEGFPTSLAPGASVLWFLRLAEGVGPGTYEITVSYRSTAGNRSFPVRIVLASTAVERTPLQPAEFVLHAPVPNPFNPLTRIPFTLQRPASLEAHLVAVTGQRIRAWALPALAAGEHSLVWDGTTDTGTAAASGVYLLCLRDSAGGRQQVQRLVLVR